MNRRNALVALYLCLLALPLCRGRHPERLYGRFRTDLLPRRERAVHDPFTATGAPFRSVAAVWSRRT